MNECKVCSAACENAYCSEPCYLVGSGQGFACEACGKVVAITWAVAKNRYCSRACGNHGPRTTANARHRDSTPCKNCQRVLPLKIVGGETPEEMSLIAHRRNKLKTRGYVYCSVKCNPGRVKKVAPESVACVWCSKEIALLGERRKRYQPEKLQFCSTSCASHYRWSKRENQTPQS